jgi:hypothetical protein
MLQVSIPASNVVDLLDMGFTTIEVYRSDDDGLHYPSITSATPAPAFLETVEAHSTFRVGGKSVRFEVDGGVEKTVEFPLLTEYFTPALVADAFNAVVADIAAVVGMKVVLTSASSGPNSSLVITYCDALELGFSAGDTARGSAAHIALNPAILLYVFSDVNGFGAARYAWRFSAGGANPKTELLGFVQGSNPPALGVNTALCQARFVGLDGKPLKSRIIIVSDAVQLVAGMALGNELPLVVDSDQYGYLEVPLVQGAKVRVAIEGTAYVREFTVPATATFDLLTMMAAAPDPFTVQVSAPFLIRRSL